MAASKTVAVSIQRPPYVVYDFVRDPANLPRWAAGLCLSVRQTAGGWIAETPDGPVGIRFAPENEYGVLDHWVTLSSGTEVYVPMRVVARGDGSELLFTIFRQDGMSDEAFAADAAMVERDLRTLRQILDGSG